MISGSAAKTLSNTATGSLNYIGSMISGATEQGLYQVYVDGKFMNNAMIDTLINVYGYKVTTKTFDMGSYPQYIVSWN
jgi:hypothetical protein